MLAYYWPSSVSIHKLQPKVEKMRVKGKREDWAGTYLSLNPQLHEWWFLHAERFWRFFVRLSGWLLGTRLRFGSRVSR